MTVRTTLLLTAVSLSAQDALPPAAQRKVDFTKDVEPILAQKCHSCHGQEAQQAGLRLDRRQNAMRGGDYGPVIVAGNGAGSKLIKRLVTGDGGMIMPRERVPLRARSVDLSGGHGLGVDGAGVGF